MRSCDIRTLCTIYEGVCLTAAREADVDDFDGKDTLRLRWNALPRT